MISDHGLTKDLNQEGHHWFFYWQTSVTSWKDYFSQNHKNKVIFVPINWAFHYVSRQEYDFGQKYETADLKRLISLGQHFNKKIVFLFPLGPVPFLPNGGVPADFANVYSIDKNEQVRCVLNAKNDVHKFYSFFGPEVYSAHRKFTKELAKLCHEFKVPVSILGVQAGCIEDGIFSHYFEDYSDPFKKGLQKYAKLEEDPSENLSETRRNMSDSSSYVKNSHHTKVKYQDLIKNLYCETASEVLSDHWKGTLELSFIGGGTKDFLRRCLNTDDHMKSFMQEILESMSNGVMPTSLLMEQSEDTSYLQNVIHHLVDKNYFSSQTNLEEYDEELFDLSPLSLIKLVCLDRYTNRDFTFWKEIGLWEHLEREYSWVYRIVRLLEDLKEEDGFTRPIHVVNSNNLTEKEFQLVLTNFMNGVKVIWDCSQLDSGLKRKLERFILENSLETEVVDFFTQVEHISLGTGSLFLFKGFELSQLTKKKKEKFWQKVFSFFNVKHLTMPLVKGIQTFWKRRESRGLELDFSEVRLLYIFNYDNRKKVAVVPHHKNYALMRKIEANNCQIDSTSSQIEVSFNKAGCAILEFGFFYE